jgi:hypothetical protein
MTVQFPQIQPTADEFVGAVWPVTETRSQSGVRSVRLWGSAPSDAGMVLTFSNITQAQAGLIGEAYNLAKGPVVDVAFPALVFNGLTDTNLLAFLARSVGTGMKPYFVGGPPQGNRVPGGSRVTMRVEFRFELRL